MDPIFHIIASLLLALIGFKFFGFYFFIGFLSGGAFLDIDHYLYYVVVFKKFDLYDSYVFFESIRNKPRAVFCIFHTFEFLLLYLFLGVFLIPKRKKFKNLKLLFWGLFGGIIFHLLLDFLQGLYLNELNFRWWSVGQYLLN